MSEFVRHTERQVERENAPEVGLRETRCLTHTQVCLPCLESKTHHPFKGDKDTLAPYRVIHKVQGTAEHS